MYLRMTDLLIDLLDRYEPEETEDDASDLVAEEPAGIEPVGQWTILIDGSLEDSDDIEPLIERLELKQVPEFELAQGLLSFVADGLSNADLISLVEAADAVGDLLEVSGELDVHERSVTWMEVGKTLEPMPMPLPRPDDEIPHLVEEFAIHLKRHTAAALKQQGDEATYGEGIEIFGRPYALLRDEIDDAAALVRILTDAGLPPPDATKQFRVEWAEDKLDAKQIYQVVQALRATNPVVGLSAGLTWRNEPLVVPVSEAD
ncbi:MAG: hypothetical protein ACYDCK_07070 [Thermoplasmatota archaeon]